MKCSVVRDVVALFSDGCVSEETRDLVEEHLDDCAECREYYRDYGRMNRAEHLFENDECENRDRGYAALAKKVFISSVAEKAAYAVTAAAVAAVSVALFFVLKRKEPSSKSNRLWGKLSIHPRKK